MEIRPPISPSFCRASRAVEVVDVPSSLSPSRRNAMSTTANNDLPTFVGKERFATVLIDPPWRFANRTGKMAPEHKRLARYETMSIEQICALPVGQVARDRAHLYLWVPNALLPW